MTPFDAFGAFDAEGAAAIDNAEDAAALLGFGEDDLDRVGGGTEEGDDFGDFLDPPEDVDGEAVAHDDDEGVASGNGLCVGDGCRLHVVVVAFGADEALARSFAEGDAEFHGGVGVDNGLIEIFYRFDEVTLTEDDVGAFRDGELNQLQFHSYILDRKYVVDVARDGD